MCSPPIHHVQKCQKSKKEKERIGLEKEETVSLGLTTELCTGNTMFQTVFLKLADTLNTKE